MDKDPKKVLANPDSSITDVAWAFVEMVDPKLLTTSNSYRWRTQQLVESLLSAQYRNGELMGMKKATMIVGAMAPAFAKPRPKIG